MKKSKEKLQRRVAECTVFSQYSISFGSCSSTYYLRCSIHIFELRRNVLNKIEAIEKTFKRPATLPKKGCTKEAFCKYIRIFSVSSTRPNVSSLFRKIVTLFKRWHTIDFFSQNILFKAANFRDMLHKYMRYMSYSLHSVGV